MVAITELSSIVVFVLATARRFQNKSSFDTRMIPISQVWGSLFDHMYFVFGSDAYDATVLQERCHLISLNSSSSQFHQNSSSLINHDIELHRCQYSRNTSNFIHDKGELQVLKFAMCEGSYYGRGPTCRCQSSLLWYASISTLSSTSWLVFIDDDVFLRPHALGTMLQTLEQNIHHSSSSTYQKQMIAIIADTGKNGMELSKKWNRTSYSCSQYYVPVAMPLILNRNAATYLYPALKSHAMLSLQRLWGGTHDMIIGLLITALDIPTYTFHRYYSNDMISRESGIHVDRLAVMIHKVKNMMKQHNIKITTIIDQYDIAQYFHDCYSWHAGGCGLNKEEVSSLFTSYDNQVKSGIQAFNSLKQIPNALSKSKYVAKRETYQRVGGYQQLVFEDC